MRCESTTVSGCGLEVAIRRLYMPEVIIQLMVALVEGQQIAVRTAGGMTGEFKVEAFNAKYQGHQAD
jgi:hypothetical protein